MTRTLRTTAALAIAAGSASAAAPDTKSIAFFESKIRPVLADKCYQCHSTQAEKLKGKFFADTRDGLRRGGESGKPAVVPGYPDKSLLIEALRHSHEDLKMPPKEKLSDAVVADFVAWIKMGAADPREGKAPAVVLKKKAATPEEGKNFWSFKPLASVTPPMVKSTTTARTPVDQFILAKLEAAKLQMNPPIQKRKLIRRAYFDLIGLPPKPEDIEAFVNDKSPRAYETLIDRLLDSPHHGERWGRHWLDLARFGESHGYEQDYDRPFAYHYRDFVIRALNDDLPYDKFVKWQIAGDELAPDDPEAWLATGFLGAGTHATQITANQAEKERYDELDDKISTIGTAMLGLTIGCARCHDHKFDPIPTADYYRLLSTFTTTVRSDHDVDLNPAETRRLQADFDARMKPLKAAREAFEKAKLPARFDAWLDGSPALPQPAWLTLDLEKFSVSGGYYGINKSTRQEDASWVVSISAGSPDTITFTAKTALTNLTALRLEALTHSSLPNGGPGWSKDGGFNLQTLTVTAKPQKGPAQPVTLKFTRRRSPDDAQPGATPIPWQAKSKQNRDHLAVFETDKPFGFAEGTEMAFTMKFPTGFDRNLIGRLRVGVTRDAGSAADAPALVLAKDFEAAQSAFGVDAAKRSGAHKESLSRVYRTTEPEWLTLNAAVMEHLRNEPRPRMVKALVCSEGLPAIRLHTQGPDFYEKTFMLKRGDLAQKVGEARPSFLQVLMRAEENDKRWLADPPKDSRTPRRRAALAHWITDPQHGAGNLLARVIVNRLWQHHLGRGIVATPSDFGATGAAPTHPELLDWLAGELIRNGWRLKPLHKLIMMSAVYQQDTATDPKRLKSDPDNQLWWHRLPQRLEAEIIRDNVLAVSGRLDPTMFGAGTLDEGMKRRSVYFFIKRSKLIPMMVQFDAPDSLQGLGLRVNTTVAPQALYMMNNPHVRASAVDFAKKLKPLAEQSPEDAVKAAYATALGRAPSKSELADATGFIHLACTTQGDKPDKLDSALADFCQVLFGLNEFVYVE